MGIRLLILNITAFGLVGGAAALGWVQQIWAADTSHLSALIAALFLLGLWMTYRAYRDNLPLKNVRWIATSLVMLGLIGTVLGFIQALADVKLDSVSDDTAIKTLVASLFSGMGVALYTTLVGSILNIWTHINLRVIEASRGA